MNIATLSTMRMVDILNLTKKEITKIGCKNVVAALTRKCKQTIWLVYGDYCGEPVILGSVASKNAAEYMITQLTKISKTDRYLGGIYEFYKKEIPYGGFESEAHELSDGDYYLRFIPR